MSLPNFGIWQALKAPASPYFKARHIGGLDRIPYQTARTGRPAVEECNVWVNHAIRYKKDLGDTWQQPSETLRLRTGDCEDYAILKRAILRQLGWADEDVLIVLAYDILARQDHAMLLVRVEDQWLMLDNRTDILQRVSTLGDYKPMVAYADGLSYIFGGAA